MSWISDELKAAWATVKTALTGEVHQAETALTDLEQKLLPGFTALVQQIEATIGNQGLTILEQGLGDIAAAIATGGNVGAAIATLVPQVVGQVQADLQQDATNAAHGAVSLLIANLPTPAVTVTPAPAAA